MEDTRDFWMHKEYPKSCAPDDFWGQIKRTVHGKPVSQEQIDMIVRAVCDGLQFRKEDVLLDLGCGNGALSRYFFPFCSSMLGVDFSPYLLDIAKKNFEAPPDYLFREDDIVAYVRAEPFPVCFTKVLCYGVYSYLSLEDARILLEILHERFINVESIFLGNLPDREKIDTFFPPGTDTQRLVHDHLSPIGVWRSRDEMERLADDAGWNAEFRVMPSGYYAAHYRFDAVLRRKP